MGSALETMYTIERGSTYQSVNDGIVSTVNEIQTEHDHYRIVGRRLDDMSLTILTIDIHKSLDGLYEAMLDIQPDFSKWTFVPADRANYWEEKATKSAETQ